LPFLAIAPLPAAGDPAPALPAPSSSRPVPAQLGSLTIFFAKDAGPPPAARRPPRERRHLTPSTPAPDLARRAHPAVPPGRPLAADALRGACRRRKRVDRHSHQPAARDHPAAGSTDLEPFEDHAGLSEPLDSEALARLLGHDAPAPGVGDDGATILPRESCSVRMLERGGAADPARYAIRFATRSRGAARSCSACASLADTARAPKWRSHGRALPRRIRRPQYTRRLPLSVAGSRYDRDQAIAARPRTPGRDRVLRAAARTRPGRGAQPNALHPAVGNLEFTVEGSG
jgi:hypothetical protein